MVVADFNRQRRRAQRSIYMRGWDDMLTGKKLRDCPYSRMDFAGWWQRGWQDCEQGKSLPWFYQEWKERNP